MKSLDAYPREFRTQVHYLRSRARWTEQLEEDLVRQLEKGEDVNLNEFGVTTETQARMSTFVNNLSKIYERKDLTLEQKAKLSHNLDY